ncbi:probable ISM1 - isoleucine--tRNA ligase, mitochondrial [Melanopsichium pennsylvanicum]|uniref:Isoleucine--tRNA ligase, mitochondrial n=2 Tax=Melanopsichium pennsylvanicum TaxID=63383 RepID=A0AAJ5C6A9_9BASI|nr:probable ISM1-isoleucine-tRNA ligase, mitochondrial [Melanopsichium pennsylvanicum 4]SNX85621.1 probable ISM1 - isoleucine--tRNA ligase, mitochondrial [Melanopsichium pennsylvanicum]
MAWCNSIHAQDVLPLGKCAPVCGAATRNFHASVVKLKTQGGKEKLPKDTGSKEFSHTLQLPNTPFGIRANAAQRDKLFYNRTCSELYQWQRERSDSAGNFVFHDGPPYANGNLHCGHALNKILKDITNRYQVLRGKRVHYMPGWDCHGLPIEAKALANVNTEERQKLSAHAIRKRATKEALKAIETQKKEFSEFGIMADWSHNATYRTLDPGYEARQLRVFGEMVRKGLIYRQFRPVYWSPSNRTALAESELEYREDHLSKAVYVACKLIAGPQLLGKLGRHASVADELNAIIWTTTPWSLPSNMAINVNPDLQYSVVRRSGTEGPCYVVGTERIEALEGLQSSLAVDQNSKESSLGPFEELTRVNGTDLIDSTYRSPLAAPNSPPRPILMADYVTALSGTGLVHSAPAHGVEDYQIWKQQGYIKRDGIFSPVDDEGRYSSDILQFDLSSEEGSPPSKDSALGQRLIGKEVLSDGAVEVLAILKERNALISVQTLRHKYPYDWRSKQPVIVRATAQWFANLDHIKEQAIEALRDVTFVPANSRARLESFISGRSEWCISRQRVWGVPIPVLYDTVTDEPLLTVENIQHIATVLESEGTDYWWKAGAEVFVAPQYRDQKRSWRKGEDTVDVWFDSGTSWATLKDQLALEQVGTARQGNVADVYLEGSDQHRGWFQSSLITAVATTPEGQKPVAPYKTVVTHGYVLDNESRKMSKSLGNVVSPLSIIQGGKGADEPAYGADVLRLWVARSDFKTDPPIGNVIISKTAETLRKLRNTARFMLANLPAADTVANLDKSKMKLLDRFVMQELYQLERSCASAYEAFDFAQVVRRLTEFANVTLSNLYLDVGKDSLYLDGVDDERRKMMVAVIDQVLRTMTGIMAPITPFLSEEIFHFRNGASSDPAEGSRDALSVFSAGWPAVDEHWNDRQAASDCTQLSKLRDACLVMIEEARQASRVKTSFEVEIDLASKDSESRLTTTLQTYEPELTEFFNVARVNVLEQGQEEQLLHSLSTRDHEDGVTIRVRRSSRHKCPRCRALRKEVEADRLCQRCQAVVDGLSASI